MMTHWLELAKSEYDVIVIDSPPIRAVADPMILANIVDVIVYVFDITKTRRADYTHGYTGSDRSLSNERDWVSFAI